MPLVTPPQKKARLYAGSALLGRTSIPGCKEPMWNGRVSGPWLRRLATPHVNGDAGFVVYA